MAEPEVRQPAKKPAPPVVPSPAKQPAAEHEPAKIFTSAVSQGAAITLPEPGGEIKQLGLNWKQIIQQAPEDTKKSPAIAILRSAGVKPVSLENDVIVLAFKYPYHKEQIEKSENQRVAEKIISNFLGRSCHVRCIYEPEDNHLLKAALKMGAQIINVEEK